MDTRDPQRLRGIIFIAEEDGDREVGASFSVTLATDTRPAANLELADGQNIRIALPPNGDGLLSAILRMGGLLATVTLLTTLGVGG